jgi:NAD(P)-dependent dehydrogenase (short-subunit alcohol dehydrogenase family)
MGQDTGHHPAGDLVARMFDVRGARTVVTGGASGIGRAIGELMADCGASVTLLDLDAGDLERTASELGAAVRWAVADVRDADAVAAAVDEVAGREGGVDVVFANAGIARDDSVLAPGGGVDEMDLETWQTMLDVNLAGVLHTLRAAARVMKPQGSGSIVVTASNVGLRPDPRMGYGYIATKAAVVNMVRQAALELAPHGIRVNAMAPGPFRTQIGAWRPPDPQRDDFLRQWVSTIPMQRMAETEEIKGLVLLLASNASSYMTGSVVTIDGGQNAFPALS